MKFTPSPWRVEGEHVKTAISAGPKHVAMVNYFDCGPGDPRSIAKAEHEANARLIAAAPELLAVCQTLVGCAVGDWRSAEWKARLAHTIDEAAAVIEKVINSHA